MEVQAGGFNLGPELEERRKIRYREQERDKGELFVGRKKGSKQWEDGGSTPHMVLPRLQI